MLTLASPKLSLWEKQGVLIPCYKSNNGKCPLINLNYLWFKTGSAEFALKCHLKNTLSDVILFDICCSIFYFGFCLCLPLANSSTPYNTLFGSLTEKHLPLLYSIGLGAYCCI